MIKNNEMKIIENFMLDDLRERVHFLYSPSTNEEFIKQYYLRLRYDEGEDTANEFEQLLYDLFNFDISNLF